MLENARDRARQAAAGMAIKAAQKAGSNGEMRDFEEAAAEMSAGGLSADTRAQGASGAVNLVVALVVGGLMSAFLLPIAIDEIASVDTSSWSGGASSLWEILPVMIVLAVFLFFTGVALQRSGRI